MPVARNILVIRLSSLGDVLLAMPAVNAIKTALPESNVSWLVEGAVAPLVAAQGFVDDVIEFPRARLSGALGSGRIVSTGKYLRSFVQRLREKDYDVVIDFHGIVKSAAMSLAARAGRTVGFGRTLAKEGSWLVYNERMEVVDKRMHKVERNMLLASRLIGARVPEVDLAVPHDADAYIDRFFAEAQLARPLVAVNPFCSKGSEFKRWGLSRYAELIERMKDATGATMVILWGPGEQEEALQLKEMAHGRAVLACPTTVPQLLALLKRIDLYVGGDTGVMHLAALARTPVVAVFGPTDHLVNGPYGTNHRVIRKELPCSPCRDKTCTRRECLTSIGVDEVLDAVMNAWNGKRQN